MVWVNIPDTDVDQDSPVTVALMTALRDNVAGAIQFDGDPPVAYSAWHPYNMVTVNDGNDGVFYDNAVNGNVNSRDSPVLVDGFEYAIVFMGIRVTAGAIEATIQRDRDNGFFGPINLGAGATIADYNGYLFAYRSRDLSREHALEPGGLFRNVQNLAFKDNNGTFRVRIIRISVTGSELFTGGKLALYRRIAL